MSILSLRRAAVRHDYFNCECCTK